MTGFTAELMKLRRYDEAQYDVVNHFIQGIRTINAIHGHVEEQYGEAHCTIKFLGTSLTGPYPDSEGTMFCSSVKQIVKGLRGGAKEEAEELHKLVKVTLEGYMNSTEAADQVLAAIEALVKRKMEDL